MSGSCSGRLSKMLSLLLGIIIGISFAFIFIDPLTVNADGSVKVTSSSGWGDYGGVPNVGFVDFNDIINSN